MCSPVVIMGQYFVRPLAHVFLQNLSPTQGVAASMPDLGASGLSWWGAELSQGVLKF